MLPPPDRSRGVFPGRSVWEQITGPCVPVGTVGTYTISGWSRRRRKPTPTFSPLHKCQPLNHTESVHCRDRNL